MLLKEGKTFKIWCKEIIWQALIQNQSRTEILFIEDWKPEKWKEWVWVTKCLLMKIYKALKVNKVKNKKPKVTKNTLVTEVSPPLKRDKLLLETEMPSKLPITLSITPIISKTSLMNIKVSSQSQDSIKPLLQLS